jgi:hypothetical protein
MGSCEEEMRRADELAGGESYLDAATAHSQRGEGDEVQEGSEVKAEHVILIMNATRGRLDVVSVSRIYHILRRLSILPDWCHIAFEDGRDSTRSRQQLTLCAEKDQGPNNFRKAAVDLLPETPSWPLYSFATSMCMPRLHIMPSPRRPPRPRQPWWLTVPPATCDYMMGSC